MGVSKYIVAKQLCDELKKEKTIYSFEEFLNLIRMKIGTDEKRTVRPTVKLMLEFKLVTGEGDDVRIN